DEPVRARAQDIDRFVGAKVDTDGVLPDGTNIEGINDLRNALTARPAIFVENLAGKLMLYALGRPIEAKDMPTVRSIVESSEKNDYAFYDLVQGIVSSAQFRKVQAEVPAAEKVDQAVSVAQKQ
ncbi:MAG: DUF1585 domain-containing protein, partial [Pseudomonadota bacterium]